MDTYLYVLPVFFFFIAFLYSSAGFGGGSLYLALLALSGASMQTIRPTALVCNIIVVASSVWIFWRKGLLNLKSSIVFIAASLPLTYLGALWRIEDDQFFNILGISLIAASVLLWTGGGHQEGESGDDSRTNLFHALAAGSIGLLSGVVGIGGGIFLAPVLHFMKWGTARMIAAQSSLFILLNSLSGLAGYATHKNFPDVNFILPLGLSVLIGGQAGARAGVLKLNLIRIRQITAIIIFIAGTAILKEHL